MGNKTKGKSNVHEYVENSVFAHFSCGSEEAVHPAVFTTVPPPTHYSSVLCSSVMCCLIGVQYILVQFFVFYRNVHLYSLFQSTVHHCALLSVVLLFSIVQCSVFHSTSLYGSVFCIAVCSCKVTCTVLSIQQYIHVGFCILYCCVQL